MASRASSPLSHDKNECSTTHFNGPIVKCSESEAVSTSTGLVASVTWLDLRYPCSLAGKIQVPRLLSIWTEIGCARHSAPLWGRRAGSPSNTMWPAPRPTWMSSFILIRPTVWPQYTNVTDRPTDRQDRTGQTDRQTDRTTDR